MGREFSHALSFAALLVRSFTSSNLSDFYLVERFQLRTHYIALLYLNYGLFQAIQEGLISEDHLNVMLGGTVFEGVYFRSMWPSIRKMIGEEYGSFIDATFHSDET